MKCLAGLTIFIKKTFVEESGEEEEEKEKEKERRKGGVVKAS